MEMPDKTAKVEFSKLLEEAQVDSIKIHIYHRNLSFMRAFYGTYESNFTFWHGFESSKGL